VSIVDNKGEPMTEDADPPAHVSPGGRRGRILSGYPALQSSAYRRFLFALLMSELGLYAFETALFWTALESTGSATLVGVLYAALIAPVLLLTIPVGMATDRIGPRRLMLVSSAAAGIVLVLAAVLVGEGRLTPTFAIGLAVAEGVFFGFWAVPAQVLTTRVVERRHITSAIGLAALPAGIGSIGGGALGGIVLETAGPRATFVLAAACVGISVFAVASLPKLVGLESGGRAMALRDATDAFRFMRTSPVVLSLVFLAAIAALFVMSRYALFPSLVRDVLEAGPASLGLLISATGVGSIAGALANDGLGRRLGQGRVLVLGLAASGLALAALGLVGSPLPALAFGAAIATGYVVHQVTVGGLLQLLAPARMRGRVVATFDLVRLGLVPIGGLVAGLLSDGLDTAFVFLVFGLLTVAGAVGTALLWRPTWSLAVDDAGLVEARFPSGWRSISQAETDPDVNLPREQTERNPRRR
jgi:MFS family permease